MKTIYLYIIYIVRIKELTLGYYKEGYIRLLKDQNYIVIYYFWLEYHIHILIVILRVFTIK